MGNRTLNQHKAVARKRVLIEEARTGPCIDCGRADLPWRAMDLDHVPGRGPKLFSVGAALSGGKGNYRSAEMIQAEIAKCDRVCPTCHRLRTLSRTMNSTGSPGPEVSS